MSSKKFLVAALAILVLAGGAYYFSTSSSLQGRFSGIRSTTPATTGPSTTKTTTKPTTTSTLLTVTGGTSTSNLVDLSTVDFTDTSESGSTWFTVGKFTTSLSSGSSFCGDIRLAMNDGSTTFQYQNWLGDMFDDVRLQYRTSSGTFVGYIDATSGSDLSTFDPSSVGASGDGYFLVDVKAKSGVTSHLDKNLYIYISSMCAQKSGSKYYWWYDDNMSQNSYFSMTADNYLGLTVGYAKVQE